MQKQVHVKKKILYRGEIELWSEMSAVFLIIRVVSILNGIG
jgi:hypothetical protein